MPTRQAVTELHSVLSTVGTKHLVIPQILTEHVPHARHLSDKEAQQKLCLTSRNLVKCNFYKRQFEN